MCGPRRLTDLLSHGRLEEYRRILRILRILQLEMEMETRRKV